MERDCETVPTNAKVNKLDLVTVIREAIERTGEPHKVLAAEAGYQPDYWARVLTGERGLSLDRLGRLPIHVQREIVFAWARALEMQVERRRAPRGSRQQLLEALHRAAQVVAQLQEAV